jgi:hypothetical protein
MFQRFLQGAEGGSMDLRKAGIHTTPHGVTTQKTSTSDKEYLCGIEGNI